jgi:hypothetical protein
VPALQLFVPLMMAPVALLPSVWPLNDCAKVNALVNPETLKIAPPATLMLAELVIEPPPVKANVPELIMVDPL